MKNLITITAFVIVFLLFTAVKTGNNDANTPLPTDLHEFVAEANGIWITPKDALLPDAALRDVDLMIVVDTAWIDSNRVEIYVSEYCDPRIADRLVFELCGDHLEYVGATRMGNFRDFMWIDYITLNLKEVDGEKRLIYEAMEVEGNHYRLDTLIEIPEPEMLYY